ncbi:class II 3-deoxy-7-phosphoheptulonate synthase [Pirellulaceae bacterium SH467]|jgi:3-deoxy-7-phosphoheptulonate synthase
MSQAWSPSSWKNFPAAQQPLYPDSDQLSAVVKQIKTLPPLVTSWEIDRLHQDIALAQRGQAWLLQGGDCAETFEQCQTEPIASKLKLLLQMSLAIVFGARKRIIRVGRMAGQYAKPRSSDTEAQHGVTLPCYRGDIVNGYPFTAEARTPDPLRLLRGYERSALTLNFVRALSEGGFADLHHPENWNLLFVNTAKGEAAERYKELVRSLGDSIRFMETILHESTPELKRVDFYTSHEALHLDYETALTRESVRGIGFYNMGTHFPWIGERTRQLNGAHLEYFRGIRNPVAVKIGGSIQPEELIELIDKLNPENKPGRLTLIHRMGRSKIESQLPPLIDAVLREQKAVLWVCDPMHGNTVSTAGGRKTRRFDDIVDELRLSFAIHRACGSTLGGAHLELTGEDVTECVGGSRGLTESDLESAYQTQLDPRLNYEQALEIAFEISNQLSQQRF